MNVTSAIQTQHSAATNRTNNSREIEKRDEANRILPLDELIDEEGMEVLNNLLDGMSLSEEEQQGIKLALGFSLGIKSNEVVNGKLEIIREDRQLDFGTISNKLQKIAREKSQGGFLSQEIKEIANELISYYTSKIQENLNTKDSTIDDFLEDLHSGNSTATTTASTITKENIQNKVNEYAQTLMETRGDTPESKLEVSKLLNDYKKELLQDYKDSLDGATNNTMTLQQEAIIKVLLDENTKEASSLEKLLVATTGTTSTKELQQGSMDANSLEEQLFASEVKKSSNIKELEKEYRNNAIPTIEELLDEEGMAFLNKTLDGIPEKDAIGVKLVLGFQLSIKNVSFINGNLHIERETGKLDTQSIIEKLETLSKNKSREGHLAETMSKVIEDLKTFYINEVDKINSVT